MYSYDVHVARMCGSIPVDTEYMHVNIKEKIEQEYLNNAFGGRRDCPILKLRIVSKTHCFSIMDRSQSLAR